MVYPQPPDSLKITFDRLQQDLCGVRLVERCERQVFQRDTSFIFAGYVVYLAPSTVCVHVCVYVCIYIYICIRVYVHICAYIYLFLKHEYIYIYTYI